MVCHLRRVKFIYSCTKYSLKCCYNHRPCITLPLVYVASSKREIVRFCITLPFLELIYQYHVKLDICRKRDNINRFVVISKLCIDDYASHCMYCGKRVVCELVSMSIWFRHHDWHWGHVPTGEVSGEGHELPPFSVPGRRLYCFIWLLIYLEESGGPIPIPMHFTW